MQLKTQWVSQWFLLKTHQGNCVERFLLKIRLEILIRRFSIKFRKVLFN
jgi:hypothetical protein